MTPTETRTAAKSRTIMSTLWLSYLSTVALFTVTGLFPWGRIWGINQWGFFPGWAPVVGLIIALVVPFMVQRAAGPGGRTSPGYRSRAASVAAVATPVVFLALFWLFRSRIHLYGDGYLRLESLSRVNPMNRISDFGATWILKQLYHILEAFAGNPGLLTYQVASIVGGTILVAGAVVIVRRFVSDNVDRLLFTLAVISGGYGLLFFGYVENYTLFVPAVGLYCLIGLKALETGQGRLYALIPALAAVFLHVFGVMLIPSLVYLLCSGNRVGRFFNRIRPAYKWGAVVLDAVTGLLIIFELWSSSYFVRFSLLPLAVNRYTVDSYTALSGEHLADILNLLMQLFPALPLAASLLLFRPVRRTLKQPGGLFLAVMILSSLAGVMILRPQLGMPRDWDMFAFVGLPMVILTVFLLIKTGRELRSYRKLIVAIIVLNSLGLAPRIASQVIPEVAVGQAENWGRIDPKKRIYINRALQDYYRLSGQTLKAAELAQNWTNRFPEARLMEEGRRLMGEGQFQQAEDKLQRAIAYNPMFSPAYRELGSCLLSLNKTDSAVILFKIADGFNPGNPAVLNELGVAFAASGHANEAEKCWREILRIDRYDTEAMLNLLKLYSTEGQSSKYVEALKEVAKWPAVPKPAERWLGDYYRSIGRQDLAEQHYRKAGLSSPDSTR